MRLVRDVAEVHEFVTEALSVLPEITRMRCSRWSSNRQFARSRVADA
jgi:hypothetical protein